MQITFRAPKNTTQRLLAEAEIAFEPTDILAGMKLVGFAIWQAKDGSKLHVTLPSRPNGSGEKRRFFDLLRASDGKAKTVKAVKERILEAYRAAVADHAEPA